MKEHTEQSDDKRAKTFFERFNSHFASQLEAAIARIAAAERVIMIIEGGEAKREELI